MNTREIDLFNAENWYEFGLTEHFEKITDPFSMANEAFRILMGKNGIDEEMEYPVRDLIKTATVSAYRLALRDVAMASGKSSEEAAKMVNL